MGKVLGFQANSNEMLFEFKGLRKASLLRCLGCLVASHSDLGSSSAFYVASLVSEDVTNVASHRSLKLLFFKQRFVNLNLDLHFGGCNGWSGDLLGVEADADSSWQPWGMSRWLLRQNHTCSLKANALPGIFVGPSWGFS